MTDIKQFTDAQIIAAIDAGNAGPGGRAAHILRRLGVNYAKPDMRLRRLYQRLCKLEALGKVHRDPRSSYINSIYWMTGRRRGRCCMKPDRWCDAFQPCANCEVQNEAS